MTMYPRPDTQEINGILSRINRLGTVTEHLFSRLYKGLGRRSRQQTGAPGTPTGDSSQPVKTLVADREHDLQVEQLQSILAALDDGIIMQDTVGRIVMVNEAAKQLVGSQKNIWESEIGTLFNTYRDITQLESELSPLGAPKQIQVNNRVLGVQLAALADSEGQRLGTMIVLRDITQDALSERLKEQFITAISHELRTPMAVIKGMSEVMLAQPADQKPNRRFLETLSRNVDILDRMIVELLDITELSENNFKMRQEKLDLEPLIWQVVGGLTPEIKRSQLDVAVMARGASRLRITGDEQRLRWALGHLLQNAIRYTESGGHIIVAAVAGDSDSVVIQVIDTGVGISEKDLPHVFERFYRGEARTNDGRRIDPRGLGQGLFIARAVTESHGGHLTATSQPGQGSIFTLVLPAAV